jgi:hypothetical protein
MTHVRSHYFSISRFGVFGEKDLCRIPVPWNSRLSKYLNVKALKRQNALVFDRRLTIVLEIYSLDIFLVADLLANPLDPMIGGILRPSSRVLHHPFRSLRSPLLDLCSIKSCTSPSNRIVYRIFRHDPMLDGVLPPELLLTS